MITHVLIWHAASRNKELEEMCLCECWFEVVSNSTDTDDKGKVPVVNPHRLIGGKKPTALETNVQVIVPTEWCSKYILCLAPIRVLISLQYCKQQRYFRLSPHLFIITKEEWCMTYDICKQASQQQDAPKGGCPDSFDELMCSWWQHVSGNERRSKQQTLPGCVFVWSQQECGTHMNVFVPSIQLQSAEACIHRYKK